MKKRITYIFSTIANIEESSVNSSKENDIAELNHLFKDGLIEMFTRLKEIDKYDFELLVLEQIVKSLEYVRTGEYKREDK